MSRLLFAFPVIAALAFTPSSALAQHDHDRHHGGGWHGGDYRYRHHHPHWHPYGGGVYYYGSGYQGYYEQPQFVQPLQQAYQDWCRSVPVSSGCWRFSAETKSVS